MSTALAVAGSAAETAPRRTAVLLMNLGTPDAPETTAVRRYLREFLSDPRVIDMNPVGRWLLLNLVILPFRPARSAHAYQAIWGPQGSPLLHYSQRQRELVEARLGGVPVLLAMRYGNPSLRAVVERLAADAVDELLVVPLYPQYASATTGSTLEAVMQALAALPHVPSLRVVPPFFADGGFQQAWVRVIGEALEKHPVDHVVFSYHGLPERQVRATDQTGGHCLASASCCDALTTANHACYRAQCFATTRALKARLGLATVTTAFQSRLGRVPWLQPYLDGHLTMLATQGVKKVAVVCPAFVSDCLETLEEIGIRMKAGFLAAGGQELVLVPCLNDHPAWIDALAALVRRELRP